MWLPRDSSTAAASASALDSQVLKLELDSHHDVALVLVKPVGVSHTVATVPETSVR
jgi:hypothetical protein